MRAEHAPLGGCCSSPESRLVFMAWGFPLLSALKRRQLLGPGR